MTPVAAARTRIVGLLIVLLLVQATIGGDLRVGAVAPDLLLVVAIAAGRTGGARQGALTGFAAGLVSDLYASGTPVGLGALAWCLVGYGVGAVHEGLMPDSRVLAPVVGFVATLAGIGLFLLLGDLVGQSQLVVAGRSHLVTATVGEAVWSAALAVPIGWCYAWAARGSAGVAARTRADSLTSR